MKGIAASPGIAIAKAYIVEESVVETSSDMIKEEQIEETLNALEKAIGKSKVQLQLIYKKTISNVGEKDAEIIQAHMSILEDPFLIDEIKKRVVGNKNNLVWAVDTVINEQVALFDAIEDPYIRERAVDIRDVGSRIIKNILDIEVKDISSLNEDIILVGIDITPSLLASADKNHIKGVVSEVGGLTSHTAIFARNMEIPAIFGVRDVAEQIKQGQLIAVNGNTGNVEYAIDEARLSELNKQIAEQKLIKESLKGLAGTESETIDGYRVEVGANIGEPEEIQKVLLYGAEGIGLFRTEFLYMDRNSMPDEEEQFKAYKQVIKEMSGKPVIIRTLDAGGDKEIYYLDLPKEANPFMGYRAIRICLDQQGLFKMQLRAVLRASAFGKARLMYPMISSVEEVITANGILEEVKEELRTKGVKFDENLEVGIMVEIPSAAITADILAKHVDFFSIGTNDLTQYSLAVDRTNEKVSSYYNSFNPAVLRLIQSVINVSHEKGKFTGMCGELAGNPLATILLLGMGLDEFSMSAASVLKIRKIISSVSMEYARSVRDKIMKLENSTEIEGYLKYVLEEKNLGYLLDI